MLEQQAFVAGSVAGVQDTSMFDNPFAAFVTQEIEHKNPDLIWFFARVQSPKPFQRGE